MTEDQFRADVLRRLGALEVKDAAAEVHQRNVERRLGSIEDMLRWLSRLIVGALVLAAIGFAVNGGLAI